MAEITREMLLGERANLVAQRDAGFAQAQAANGAIQLLDALLGRLGPEPGGPWPLGHPVLLDKGGNPEPEGTG